MNHRPLRRLLGLLTCALACGVAPQGFAQADKLTPELANTRPRVRAQLGDRIVAVVNDEVVTLRELGDRVRAVKAQLARQKVQPPPDDVLERQVLERLILDRAQLQFARENAIRVDDAQLDRTVQRIAEDNRMTMTQFRDVLERDGVSMERFRQDIRTDITIQRLREREVDSRVVISEGEIDNYLATGEGEKAGQEEINLGHVLIRVPENATPDQLAARRARAEQALAQLRGGAELGAVAASFSEGPEALSGGALGFRSLERLPQLFVDAVAGLKTGGVSEIVKSPNGFHILKVIERRGAASRNVVNQTHVRHILIRTNEVVSQDQARRRLLDLRERLENKAADFAELARLHSNDGSASRGGDLGWVYPGDTVPEFEQAMNALKLGEVSAPVQSPFGWHLIQVLERRSDDMSQERKRQAARNALRERKADEAYQEWLRQLRDRTFVEMRVDDR